MIAINAFSISELIPADYNPRKISAAALEQLKKSLSKFDSVEPAIINQNPERFNIIVGGHQRIKAAKELGWTEFPCVCVNLSLEDEKELNIRLNKNTGEFDLPLLKDFFAQDDLLEWGFSADDLGNLFEIPTLGLTDEDSVPELPEESTTKIGDIWILGNHRLMCGSSTEAHAVELLLNGQSPNTMITDPPYGVKYEAGWRAKAKNRPETEREKSSNLMNDDQSDWYDSYALFPGSVAYVWHASAFTDVVMDGLRRAGFEIKQQIIWNKNVHALSRSDYHWKHEPCWYALKPNGNRNWLGGRTQMTVWDVKSVISEKTKTSHPTQKPVELYLRPLECHTNNGEYVYEPFGGSGTSIIACEKINRRSLTMELDPRYCDVIIKRWQEFTGKEAVLESTGQTFAEAVHA